MSLKRFKQFEKLSPSYLFPEINRRRTEFMKHHPDVQLLSLGIGDTVNPLPSLIVNQLNEISCAMGTDNGYQGYGAEQGNFQLRTAIKNRLYPRLSHDDIFISDGAKSDLGRLQAFFGSNISVGISDPTYPVYMDGSILQGVKNIKLLPCVPSNDFLPDIPKDIDVLYVCNPNNPTGKVFTYQELQKIVDHAITHQIFIIYDGAYFSYINKNAQLPRTIYEIPGSEKVAIEINSFSKMAGFSGMRLGWTVIPKDLTFADGPCLRDDYLRFISTVFNGASNIIQHAGISVFSDQGWQGIQPAIEQTMKNARFLKDQFEAAGYTVYGGVHAPYLWVETPGQKSWDVFQMFLERYHLVVTPGIGYGDCGEFFIRVSAFGHYDDICRHFRHGLCAMC